VNLLYDSTSVRDTVAFSTLFAFIPIFLQEPFLAGPAGALLAALPQLSSPSDREQLEGLKKLSSTVAVVAASRQRKGTSKELLAG
jgi:hypothetical protein